MMEEQRAPTERSPAEQVVQQPLTFPMPVRFDRLDELHTTLRHLDSRGATEALGQAPVHSTRFVVLDDAATRSATLVLLATYDGGLSTISRPC